MSWNDAQERCQLFGGFLPSCKSSEDCDVKDLLAPMKLHEMFIEKNIMGDSDVLGDITFIDLQRRKVTLCLVFCSHVHLD